MESHDLENDVTTDPDCPDCDGRGLMVSLCLWCGGDPDEVGGCEVCDGDGSTEEDCHCVTYHI
jgi:hypothetical protein